MKIVDLKPSKNIFTVDEYIAEHNKIIREKLADEGVDGEVDSYHSFVVVKNKANDRYLIRTYSGHTDWELAGILELCKLRMLED